MTTAAALLAAAAVTPLAAWAALAAADHDVCKWAVLTHIDDEETP